MIKILRTAAFLLCTAVAAPVMAQDYDKGLAAYNVGDFDTALEELRPLGEQGHAGAQFNLGLMYSYGVGVPQDYAEAVVLAHMWFNIGGANGDERGSDDRGLIEEQMNREQIADAQARARRCLSSNYQDCG